MIKELRFRISFLTVISVVALFALAACAPIAPPPATAPPATAPPATAPPASPGSPPAPGVTPGVGERYSIGTINVADIWVDPVSGSDTNSGATRTQALRSVGEAWRRVPASVVLTQGYRIQLVAGEYPESSLVNYWENRWGTATNPIILNAVDGPHTAVFRSDMNVFNTRYLYVIGVDILPNRDAFHCEQCSYILLRQMELSGGARSAHETIKVNQSNHVYIEDSNIHGADDNSIDFVAVQYGHIRGNRIHDAQDWCVYTKGGSAYISVSENEIFNCGTGGFTSGQGTGFEFMTSPWLHYEAYGISVTNNIIHDTEGAGLGVNGGYNILMAYNTLYRVGSRSHAVEFVHGARGCDGDTATCAAHQSAGGWGGTGAEGQFIPSKHIYFFNNIVYNPIGFQSRWSHFSVHGPLTPPSGSNVANPAQADEDLRIAGNIIYNGPADLDLGLQDGCASSNPTCNSTQLRADNAINTILPQLVNPAGGDYSPVAGGNVATRASVAIPSFSWSDAPSVPAVPGGSTNNAVGRNRSGAVRSGWGWPGAY